LKKSKKSLTKSIDKRKGACYNLGVPLEARSAPSRSACGGNTATVQNGGQSVFLPVQGQGRTGRKITPQVVNQFWGLNPLILFLLKRFFMKFQIGYINIEKEQVFTNTFETAAWYEDIIIPAGKYPIFAEKFRYNEVTKKIEPIIDGWITYHLDGTIKSDNFQSLFCGVPFGVCYDGAKNKGKPATYHAQTYPHIIAESILSNSGNFELLPEFEAIEYTFNSPYTGEKITTHRIIKK
jgi:hypothetical protein